MRKLLVALRRDPAPDRAAPGRRLDDWARERGRDPATRGLVVNMASDDQGPYARVSGHRGIVPTPDALVALWSDGPPDLPDAPDAFAQRLAVWAVDEHRPKQYPRSWPDGTPSPGVKMIAFVRRRPDLTRDEFAGHWLHRHAPLALRHHVGLWAYTQNVVIESLTEEGSGVDGIAELHFASRADYAERYYDSDEGKRAIRGDVARFTDPAASAAALYTETVWRTPPRDTAGAG
ncbi:MAG: EthD domain-containing protein [Acidimicrobiia bacterium]